VTKQAANRGSGKVGGGLPGESGRAGPDIGIYAHYAMTARMKLK